MGIITSNGSSCGIDIQKYNILFILSLLYFNLHKSNNAILMYSVLLLLGTMSSQVIPFYYVFFPLLWATMFITYLSVYPSVCLSI